MSSARNKPLPPMVVIEHPDQPISPRQRAAWWHVAAALQRLEQQKLGLDADPAIAHECGTTPPQTAPSEEPTP